MYLVATERTEFTRRPIDSAVWQDITAVGCNDLLAWLFGQYIVDTRGLQRFRMIQMLPGAAKAVLEATLEVAPIQDGSLLPAVVPQIGFTANEDLFALRSHRAYGVITREKGTRPYLLSARKGAREKGTRHIC